MMKIGLVGAGHLGKIHLKCIKTLSSHYELVGFYDINPEVAAQVAEEYDVPAFAKLENLIEQVDVVDIVTPTAAHLEVALACIAHNKHLFIEKPITQNLAEARKLQSALLGKNLKIQIGHVERFNPALLALDDMELKPMFIEGHRLAEFNPRGTDVSVVHDLMIHDLDIILHLIKDKVKSVSANGVSIVSHSPDIANARIEFEQGAVVNLTASRISLKQMRKLRFFQSDAYVSIDFLKKEAQIVQLHEPEDPKLEDKHMKFPLETAKGKRIISVEMPEIRPSNAIQQELEDLALSIIHNRSPKIKLEDGIAALELAEMIHSQIASTTTSS